MSREPIETIGFCGKIPSKGDFVQSNFNSDFLKHWNEWLQAIFHCLLKCVVNHR